MTVEGEGCSAAEGEEMSWGTRSGSQMVFSGDATDDRALTGFPRWFRAI